MSNSPNKRQTWLICLGLALAILAAYAPLRGCGFVEYDDPSYVKSNDMVQHGITPRSLTWAFTTGHAGNWHPLTWISHIVDFQIYGLNPIGHHLTNLLLHVANSILLFLILRRMTGAMWPAAVVAALFGLHPLHVESVAWISERKDVLSTLFWMLTVWAYARYVEESRGQGPKRKRFYVLALLFFAFGLMAKPMLVTLPFILLLLDFWPLGRIEFGRWRWREKLPFFFLAGPASTVTFLVQQRSGAMASFDNTPLGERLAAIPVSYLRYMGKTLWPRPLAILYPYPDRMHLLATGAAAAVLALITRWTIRRSGAQPYLVVGWLWFLGGLVPVIGLVQVGAQVMADRYSYIPIVGLFIMMAWGVRDWNKARPGPLPALLGGSALAVCLILTPPQVWYWQNSRELFTHAIAVSKNNYMACVNLGDDYVSNGEEEKAMTYYREALRIAANYPPALNGLGKVFFSEGRVDEALGPLEQGVRGDPKNGQIRYNLGYVLLAKGRVAEALEQFQQQVDLTPDDFSAQKNFADVLLQQGLADDAMTYFQKAAEIRPHAADPHYKLGSILLRKGRAAEAVAQFEQALQIQPDNMQSCSHLAWALATSPVPTVRQGARAVELALRAGQLAGGENPQVLGILAAAYAEAGRFPEAVTTVQRARQLALAQTNSLVADVLDQQLKLYQAGLPFRDNSGQGQGNQK